MPVEYLGQKDRFVIDTYGKYFSNERINDFFYKNKIRFTPPSEFNDPLEFKPTLKGNKIHNKYKFRDRYFPSKADMLSSGIIAHLSDNYGVLSLTKVPDSYYMWSMYANGHKGFFVVFKDNFNLQPSLRDGEIYYPIKKVNYTNNYYLNIEVNHIDQDFANNFLQTNHEKICFTKLKRWFDEKEYRIVRPLKNLNDKLEKSLFDFDLNYVSDIVFGASMSIENKFLIRKECGERNIKFYQVMIFKDSKDYEQKLGKIIIWPIPEEVSWEKLERMNVSHFCTDLEIKCKEIAISNLDDLPYSPERVIYRTEN